MAAAIELRGVTKRIGQKTIVDNLTFEIPQGEVFGLLGPNGAGKTTTIRMIVGLIGITAGDILIQGFHLNKDRKQAIAQVGAIVENPEMYKYLTGYQNLVQYARMVSGVTKARIDDVIEFVGLTSAIHERVKTYSLGMRQRLGLAQALLHRPSVLILDEPTNGLDPAGIRELRDHLRRLAKEEGVAVVVSSHLLSEMELMCDRVAIIQDGRLKDVQRIEHMVGGETDVATYFIELDVPEQGYALLHDMAGVTGCSVVNQGIELSISRSFVPTVHKRIVDSGLQMYEFARKSASLEDKFLEMTGGAAHVVTSHK